MLLRQAAADLQDMHAERYVSSYLSSHYAALLTSLTSFPSVYRCQLLLLKG